MLNIGVLNLFRKLLHLAENEAALAILVDDVGHDAENHSEEGNSDELGDDEEEEVAGEDASIELGVREGALPFADCSDDHGQDELEEDGQNGRSDTGDNGERVGAAVGPLVQKADVGCKRGQVGDGRDSRQGSGVQEHDGTEQKGSKDGGTAARMIVLKEVVPNDVLGDRCELNARALNAFAFELVSDHVGVRDTSKTGKSIRLRLFHVNLRSSSPNPLFEPAQHIFVFVDGVVLFAANSETAAFGDLGALVWVSTSLDISGETLLEVLDLLGMGVNEVGHLANFASDVDGGRRVPVVDQTWSVRQQKNQIGKGAEPARNVETGDQIGQTLIALVLLGDLSDHDGSRGQTVLVVLGSEITPSEVHHAL